MKTTKLNSPDIGVQRDIFVLSQRGFLLTDWAEPADSTVQCRALFNVTDVSTAMWVGGFGSNIVNHLCYGSLNAGDGKKQTTEDFHCPNKDAAQDNVNNLG